MLRLGFCEGVGPSLCSAFQLSCQQLVQLTEPIHPALLTPPPRPPMQFWVMLKEISTSPSPAAMTKWMDHPTLGPLVAELWKSTQKGQ